MTDHADTIAGTAHAQGWIATYLVEVIFDADADAAGRGYDHVATLARCRHCREEFHLRHGDNILEHHARAHQAELGINPGTPSNPYPHPRR